MARRTLVRLGFTLALAVLMLPPCNNAQAGRGTIPGWEVQPPEPRLLHWSPQRQSQFLKSPAAAPRRLRGPNDVAELLRARGYRDIGAVRQRGTTFIADAEDGRGARVRLVIDARTGEISGERVLGPGK